MLNLGWVDFSKSDRDMVMSVLRQLTEPTCLAQMKRQILLKRRRLFLSISGSWR